MSTQYRVRALTDEETRWDLKRYPMFIVERRVWDFILDIIPWRTWEKVSRVHDPADSKSVIEKDMGKRREAGRRDHTRNSFTPIHATAFWLYTPVQELAEALGASGWAFSEEPELKITIDTKG